jgi:hypothetical protein
MRHQRTGGDYRVAFGGEIIEEFLADFTAFHDAPWAYKSRSSQAGQGAHHTTERNLAVWGEQPEQAIREAAFVGAITLS